jgi:CheY-like chemotaxis protein
MPDISPAGESPVNGLRVLVVEDEFLIALDIDRILESAGAKQVLTAGRIDEALRILSDDLPIHAVVLDLKLDKDSTLPIAEKLQALGIPFVFLTGSPEAPATRGFPRAPIVAKPFDSTMLIAGLSLALGPR